MADDTCYNLIRNMPEFDQIKDKQIDQMTKAIDNIKAMAEKKGFSFEAKMMEELQNLKMQTLNDKIEIKTQAERVKKALNFAAQEQFKNNPYRAVLGLLNGSFKLAEGEVNSIANRTAAMRKMHETAYYAKLKGLGPEALQVMKNGEIDKQIYIEMERLQNANSKLADTGSDMAKKIAKVQVDLNNNLRLDIERGVGHPIGDVLSYITKQVHDREKVRGDGSPAAIKAWSDSILQRLDQEKTFGAKAAGQDDLMRESLEKSWNSIVKGERSNEAFARSLHFLDAEHAFEYNKEWGNKTLFESSRARISDTARNVGQMDILGPNPRKGLESVLDSLSKRNRDANGQNTGFSKQQKRMIEANMANLEGYATIPGDSRMADVGRDLRSFNTLTSMGQAPIRIAAHGIINGGMELKSALGLNALQTVNAMLQMTFDTFKPWQRHDVMVKAGIVGHEFGYGVGGMFAEDATRGGQAAAKAAQFFDMLGMNNFANETRNRGIIGASVKPFMQMSGYNTINEIRQASIARMLMNGVHDQSHLTFDQLGNQFRANLKRADISAGEWEVLRTSKDKLPSGTDIIGPDKILEAPDSLVEKVMKDEKIRGNQDQFLRNLQVKYGTYLHASEVITNGHGDNGTRAFINQGLSEDDAAGQAMRMLMQFKSYTLFRGNTMVRFLHANPDASTFGMLPGKSIGALSTYIASSAVMWHASQQLLNVAKGKPMDDPTKFHTWETAFYKSGAIGMVGDFMDAQTEHAKTRQSALAYMAGPTANKLMDVGQMANDLAHGKDIRKQAGSFLANSIPAQNLWWSRRAMEPLILDPIREMVDPTYAYRKRILEQRAALGR